MYSFSLSSLMFENGIAIAISAI